MTRPESRISRVTIFEGPVFEVHTDRVRLPDGQEVRRDVVEHPGSVVLIPVIDGDLVLVRQYRYVIGRHVLELPAGTLDRGEEAEAGAARELQEETGYSAGDLTEVGRWYPSPGYTNEIMRFFLARELTPGPSNPESDETIEVARVGVDDAVRQALAGELADLKTVAGVLWLARTGGA